MQDLLIKFAKKFNNSLRLQLLIFTLVAWGVALSIDRTYVETFRVKADDFFATIPPLADVMVRTSGQKVAIIILAILETSIFGFGVAFLICAGSRVFKISNSLLRKRMIGSWIAIGFFCISWWPHSTAHSLIMTSSLDPYDNYIIMEVCFHWTIMACSVVLSYYQYDLIRLMYEVAMMREKMSKGKEVDPLLGPWYKNFVYHSFVIFAIGFGVGMALMFELSPIPYDELVRYQVFFYVTFKIVDSLLLGLGCAFAYVVVRIIFYLPSNRGRKVAIISSFCIWFNYAIQVPHPIIHGKLPTKMINVIAVDYGVHIPIILTTGILAFYQFRMLELATDKNSALGIATRMRKGSNSLSMKTMSQTNGSAAISSQNNSQQATPNNQHSIIVENSAISTSEQMESAQSNSVAIAIDMETEKPSLERDGIELPIHSGQSSSKQEGEDEEYLPYVVSTMIPTSMSNPDLKSLNNDKETRSN